MQLETYVYARGFEVWVQNFRLRGGGDHAFCVNRPSPGMGLVEPVMGPLPADAPPVFARAATAEAARRFFREADQAALVRRLGLRRGESLMVLARQIILHSRGGSEAFVRSRFETLAALFAHASEPVTTRAVLAAACALEIAGADEPAASNWFGGPPERALECRNCAAPLHQILSLDADVWPLAGRLPSFHRIPVALCLNCQTMSAPLVLRRAGRGWTVWAQPAAERFYDLPPVLPRRALRVRPAAEPSGDGSRRRHRLGGEPDWLQAQEPPDCPGCANVMAFLAQLDGDDALGMQFGDDGRLYAFVCADCRAVATVVQSR